MIAYGCDLEVYVEEGSGFVVMTKERTGSPNPPREFVGLVYIATVAPDVDETVQRQLDPYPTHIFGRVQVSDGCLWMQPNAPERFAGDLSAAEQKLIFATHYAPVADLWLHTSVDSGKTPSYVSGRLLDKRAGSDGSALRLMTLEQYIAHLNSLAFWKEFTFAQNKFAPKPGQEIELADNLAWIGDHAFVMQLKQRADETQDPEIERNWFKKKVLGKATKQVRDTLRFLDEHKQICITNEQGHSFDIRRAELAGITKIVVFLGGRALPEDCWHTRYYVSSMAGFIHILAAHDYLGILEKLRVPEDVRRYFVYREKVTPRLFEARSLVDESDIMGAFLNDEDLPTLKSRESLLRLVQDLEQFDLSRLIGSLHNHIQHSNQPHDYYRIMQEFARVPRSVWREAKIRFIKSLEAVQRKELLTPFRFTFPATDCTFMIASLPPEIPATESEGEKARLAGLQSLTYAAMYGARASKGVGIALAAT